MKASFLHQAVDDPEQVFALYEEYKRTYKDTDKTCKDQGFVFTPMVIEAHSGAWSSQARFVLAKIAKHQAAVKRESVERTSLKIAQRISITLHRENARAVLRRCPRPEDKEFRPSGWDEAVDVDTIMWEAP